MGGRRRFRMITSLIGVLFAFLVLLLAADLLWWKVMTPSIALRVSVALTISAITWLMISAAVETWWDRKAVKEGNG